MLLFTQRKKLAKLFEEWRKQVNGDVVPASCPENVVTFLCTQGLIDEARAKEYLDTHQPKNKK